MYPEIESAVSDFAREPNGGLIATASASGDTQREQIVALAARYKLPAVYFNREHVLKGGLISYGTDFVDMYRRAASYVDCILKGEKPADMPVQALGDCMKRRESSTRRERGVRPAPRAILAFAHRGPVARVE